MMLAYVLQFLLPLISNIAAGRDGPWWDLIPEELRLIFSLMLFFVNLLVLTIVLFLSGLIVVGRKRALLSDAFIIALLGTILSTLFFMFIPYRLIALTLGVVVWLLLIRALYETGWLGAIAVGILSMIVFLAVTVFLALFFGILHIILELFTPFMFLIF